MFSVLKFVLRVPKNSYDIDINFDVPGLLIKKFDNFLRITIDTPETNFPDSFWIKQNSLFEFINHLSNNGLKVDVGGIEVQKVITKLAHIKNLKSYLEYLKIPYNDYMKDVQEFLMKPNNHCKPFHENDTLGSILILRKLEIPLLKESVYPSLFSIKKFQKKLNTDIFNLESYESKRDIIPKNTFKILSLDVVIPKGQFVAADIIDENDDHIFEVSGSKFLDHDFCGYLSKLPQRLSRRKHNSIICYDSSLYVKNLKFLYPIQKLLPYHNAEILHENNNLIIQYYTDQSIESALSFIFKEKVHYLEFDVEEKKVIMEDHLKNII